MRDFLELARDRRSTRSYDTDRTVEEDKLNYILECARIAPSAVNRQPWRFYVVRSEDGKAKLRQCYSREWFNEAPLYILLTIRHDESWHRRVDGKDHGDIDVAIAAEHICLAATEQGLGTCWVCNFDAPLLHGLLCLPEEEEAAVIIPVGYAQAEVEASKRTERKPMEAIVAEL